MRGSAVATAESAPLLIDVTPLSLRVETVDRVGLLNDLAGVFSELKVNIEKADIRARVIASAPARDIGQPQTIADVRSNAEGDPYFDRWH